MNHHFIGESRTAINARKVGLRLNSIVCLRHGTVSANHTSNRGSFFLFSISTPNLSRDYPKIDWHDSEFIGHLLLFGIEK